MSSQWIYLYVKTNKTNVMKWTRKIQNKYISIKYYNMSVSVYRAERRLDLISTY